MEKRDVIKIACAFGSGYAECMIELRKEVDRYVCEGYTPIGSMSVSQDKYMWCASQMLELDALVRGK